MLLQDDSHESVSVRLPAVADIPRGFENSHVSSTPIGRLIHWFDSAVAIWLPVHCSQTDLYTRMVRTAKFLKSRANPGPFSVSPMPLKPRNLSALGLLDATLTFCSFAT